MYAIYKIARAETRSLFVSPVAWVMIVIFVIHTSVFFLSHSANMARLNFLGLEPDITSAVFESSAGVFGQVYRNLLYYIPLLTMALISREVQNGSIKLLMSSPIRIIDIVLGKYIALLIFVWCYVFFIAFLIVVAWFLVPHLDVGLTISGLFGMFLLAATYGAIGLFLSSWTSHQIVAAISTIGILIALMMIGAIGQRVPIIDEVSYWLSIAGRANYLREGLIASKDVIYFIIVSALFLVFTYLKLSGGRKVESISVRGGRYLVYTVAAFVIGYVSSIPILTRYLDVTSTEKMTLSPGSVEALKGIDGKLEVTAFVNVLDVYSSRFLPERRKTLERYLFDQYARFIPGFSLKYTYYYAPTENEGLYKANPGKTERDLAIEYAEQNGLDFDRFLSLEEIGQRDSLADYGYRNVFLFEYEGKQEIVGTFSDNFYFPDEKEITAGLRRLTMESVLIGYTVGNGERRVFSRDGEGHRAYMSDRTNRRAMVNNGFDIDQVNLTEDIPDTVDILVVAAPTERLDQTELDSLRSFIASGRNALILIDASATGFAEQLEASMSEFGLKFGRTSVSGGMEGFPDEIVSSPLMDGADNLSFRMPRETETWPIVLSGAISITSIRSGAYEMNALLGMPSTETGALGASGINESSFLGVALTRETNNTQQKIVVIGDGDFLSTETYSMREPARRNNTEFINDLFYLLSSGVYPIDDTRPEPKDTQIILKVNEMGWLRAMLYLVVPFLLIGIGGTVIYRRRRV